MSATSTNRLHLDTFPPHLITAHLDKPFDIDTVLDVVKQAEQRLQARGCQAAAPGAEVKKPGDTGTL